MIGLVLIGFLSILIISLNIVNQGVTESAFDHLKSARELKKRSVEDYFVHLEHLRKRK